MRGASVFCLVLVVVLAHVPQVCAQRILGLSSGKKLVLYDVKVMAPSDGGRKILRADVAVPGGNEHTRKELSVFADEFFMQYFGVYAEKEGFESVAVSFKRDVSAGPLTFTTAETFKYNLRKNGVWEPEHDSVKDDEPLPEPTPLELPSGNTIAVEWAGISYLYKADRKGWGTNYWSGISFQTNPAAVYRLTREYWNFVKAKVDPSIGTAGIFAFDEPRKGLFHFRKHMYVIIRTNEKGEWQELPPTWEEATGQKSRLIEARFGPGGLETVWPEHREVR